MQKITLYRYERPDGGIDVSPRQPVGVEYTTLWRLVADEGMELVKDDIRITCIDTDDDTGWEEVPIEENDENEQI